MCLQLRIPDCWVAQHVSAHYRHKKPCEHQPQKANVSTLRCSGSALRLEVSYLLDIGFFYYYLRRRCCPLEEGGVAMPHNEEGLHRGSFPPQEELSSQVEFCKEKDQKQS